MSSLFIRGVFSITGAGHQFGAKNMRNTVLICTIKKVYLVEPVSAAQ